MHLITSIEFRVRVLIHDMRYDVLQRSRQGRHTKMSPRTDPFDLIPMWYIFRLKLFHKHYDPFLMVSEIIIDSINLVEIKNQVNLSRHPSAFQILDDPDSFHDLFKACTIVEIRISEYSL